MNDNNKHLHAQLIKLGDMMGDGLHHEPDGKWISREYKKVAKALGYGQPRANNSEKINEVMAEKVKTVKCPKCSGDLKQTRSGSFTVKCSSCGGKFKFKRGKKK